MGTMSVEKGADDEAREDAEGDYRELALLGEGKQREIMCGISRSSTRNVEITREIHINTTKRWLSERQLVRISDYLNQI